MSFSDNTSCSTARITTQQQERCLQHTSHTNKLLLQDSLEDFGDMNRKYDVGVAAASVHVVVCIRFSTMAALIICGVSC